MKLLVKFDDNWADEMDMDGFKLFNSKEEWEKLIEDFVAQHKDDHDCEEDEDLPSICISFGTNEDNEYDTMEELLRNFELVEVTDEEAAALEHIFPECVSHGYGQFPLHIW